MGFSLTATAAIIGVAMLMSLEVLWGATLPTLEDINDKYDNMKDRSIERVQTEITITDIVWNNPNTIISVENNGSISVNTTNFNILFNGISKSFSCNLYNLHPEQTAIFSVVEPINPGDIIKIVTPNGVSDYYTFQ